MGKQKINCKIFTPQNVVISMMDMLGYKENALISSFIIQFIVLPETT